jgi:hypothetical protein
MSLGKWIPVVIAILTVIADEMDAEKSASTVYFFISKLHPIRAADRKKKDESSQSI